MVLHEATDKNLPMGRGGSATLFKHQNKRYCALTRHQITTADGDPISQSNLETVRVHATRNDGLTNIPLQSCLYEIANPEEEFHDILIFEVFSKWNASSDAPYFAELREFASVERPASFAVGYPAIPSVMKEYHDSFLSGSIGAIHLKRAIFDCRIKGDFKTNARNLKLYQYQPLNRIVDGMSGGAVFSLIGDLGSFEIVLDGIIVRGGSGHLYVVDSSYLVTALNHGK
ncbi:hypothetical protein NO932_17010 [Pelagibacterium sp. 26DY04]|uniref:hypothetical protein n=1 Tax=Pelagibacterium sp. 26DY04 TaxID=2967130 RepID=UPI00281603B7|nr:hypothetical protein [Pelagibacterium sp. 26DY04]WMT86577.1 hypothetical protein NO932_17010 [Pelagibacterium sp. 26DY04]